MESTEVARLRKSLAEANKELAKYNAHKKSITLLLNSVNPDNAVNLIVKIARHIGA